WDEVRVAGVIPASSWSDQADPLSVAVDRVTLGVECGPDLAWARVAVAGVRPDGDWHVELDEEQHTKGRGTAWLVPWWQAVVEADPQVRSGVVDGGGAVAARWELYRHGRWRFAGARIEVRPVRVGELGAGCARVLDGVGNGTLWHIGLPQLTSAVLAAG